jgi:hypothetical protein
MKIFTIADVPDDLAQDWLQHLRDFDTAHPGCHFEVAADAPNLTINQTLKVLQLAPSLTFIDIFRRRPGLADDD